MQTYILLDPDVRDRDTALRALARVLEENGAVQPGYAQAVVEREASYPTGLPTDGVATAIPHASHAFVNSSAAAFGRLKQPVRFRSMEDPEEELDVRLIFLLALQDAEEHTAALRRLMQLFQQPDLLQALCNAQDEAQVRALL